MLSLSTKGIEITCFIIIVDDGSAARLPLAPAAKSKAASPHALPIQSVKIGILTYLHLVNTYKTALQKYCWNC